MGRLESEKTPGRILSTDEIYWSVRSDLTNALGNQPTIEDLINLFEKKTRIISLKNADVAFIDYEYLEDPNIPPILQAYMASDRVQYIFVEYFYPELVQNANSSPLIIHKLPNDYRQLRQTHPKMNQSWTARLEAAGMISEALADLDKTIVTADIADRPGYMVLRDYLPIITSSILGFLEGSAISLALTGDPFVQQIIKEVLLLMGLHHGETFLNIICAKAISESEIKTIEKWFPHLEIARRIILATAIRQLEKSLNPHHPSNPHKPLLIVPYPKAHNNRVIEFLLNPPKIQGFLSMFKSKSLKPTINPFQNAF